MMFNVVWITTQTLVISSFCQGSLHIWDRSPTVDRYSSLHHTLNQATKSHPVWQRLHSLWVFLQVQTGELWCENISRLLQKIWLKSDGEFKLAIQCWILCWICAMWHSDVYFGRPDDLSWCLLETSKIFLKIPFAVIDQRSESSHGCCF